jgi:nucleotide-binding universal stress UspA family protein
MDTVRVLLALDLDDATVDLLKEAERWLRPMNAVVDIAYIDVDGVGASQLMDPELKEMVMRDWDAYRVRYITQCDMLLMKLPHAMRGKSIVERGPVAEALVRIAADQESGLVMLSTHGRKGLRRALLGSVAEKMVRTSPVPVLVLRGGLA